MHKYKIFLLKMKIIKLYNIKHKLSLKYLINIILQYNE